MCMSTHYVYLFWLDPALLGGAPLEHHGDRLALLAVAVMMLLISRQQKDWYQCKCVCLPIMCTSFGSTLPYEVGPHLSTMVIGWLL